MATKKADVAKAASGSANPNASADEAPAAILRKITPRHVLEMDVAKYLNERKDEEGPFDLFTVYGIANGTKSGSTTYGQWEALTGTFEAQRYDGRRFQAGVCFLPAPLGEMLIGALKAKQEEDADVSIRFAVAVGVKRMKKRDGTDGYEFTARNVVKVEQADPLADLRAKALSYEG